MNLHSYLPSLDSGAGYNARTFGALAGASLLASRAGKDVGEVWCE